MATKYLIYTGIFLLLGACSNKAIYNMIWIKYVLKPAYEYYRDPVNTYEGFAMVDPDRFIR